VSDAYCVCLVEPIIHKNPTSSEVQRSSDEKPLGVLFIPDVKGVS
jgi:hypothetical protein